jgi:hypothetical protein
VHNVKVLISNRKKSHIFNAKKATDKMTKFSTKEKKNLSGTNWLTVLAKLLAVYKKLGRVI